MEKIEVDKEKLKRLINGALATCMDLNYHIFKYKSCFNIKCQDCPLSTAESTIEWLKEEKHGND